MSIESTRAFIERMKTDEDFNKQVSEFNDAEERMNFVKTAGFDFTVDEVKEVSCEMSDDELSAVSGGFSGCLVITWLNIEL